MRRSSRILCFVAMATIAPSLAEARGFGGRGIGRIGGPSMGGALMGRPPGGGVRLGLPRLAFRPGVVLRAGGRFGRFGRGGGRGFGGYGFGGYGLDGGGLGLADLGLGTLPYGDGLPPVGGDGPPPGFMPVVLPPPACPLIIAVGGGLRHPARTRVVYGRQPFCRR